MLYHPSNHVFTVPTQFGQAPQELWLASTDNTQIHGLYFTIPKAQKPQALIVYFHGNGGNLTGYYPSMLWVLAQRTNFLVFDYHGYGQTEGHPSPENTVEDGKTALRWASARAKELHVPLIVFGQSLGGAISLRTLLDLQKENIKADALIIDSSFLSYKQVAQRVLSHSWITWPVQWLTYLLLSDHYAPGDAIKSLYPLPILVIHGTADATVDYDLGQDLFAKANEPKEFLKIPDGKHIDVFMHDNGDYRSVVFNFLVRHLNLEFHSNRAKK